MARSQIRHRDFLERTTVDVGRGVWVLVRLAMDAQAMMNLDFLHAHLAFLVLSAGAWLAAHLSDMSLIVVTDSIETPQPALIRTRVRA